MYVVCIIIVYAAVLKQYFKQFFKANVSSSFVTKIINYNTEKSNIFALK